MQRSPPLVNDYRREGGVSRRDVRRSPPRWGGEVRESVVALTAVVGRHESHVGPGDEANGSSLPYLNMERSVL